MLVPGESFYIDIFFSGNEGDGVTFRGGWSQEVPEPSTLALADRACRGSRPAVVADRPQKVPRLGSKTDPLACIGFDTPVQD
jgi:hypothetical protein